MKILWVNPNFLHPTNKGGQIRTLEIVRALHARHEIHYAALTQDGLNSEGPRRASEYSTKSYAYPHAVPSKRSLAFVAQLAAGAFSEMPLAVSRFYSPQMAQGLAALIQSEKFDRLVCDFLVPAPHFPDPSKFVLFQHNVETMIWRRHVEHAKGALQRAYLQTQATRMERYEGKICRAAGSIVAVSDVDARTMRDLFQVTRVDSIPTGVNLTYFAPPAQPPLPPQVADLVFVGSMDWMPNVDGVDYFAKTVLPIIRQRKPDCSVAIVGRDPSPATLALAQADPRFFVTGTVPDVRPYLWAAKASIVPLRIGGGTRLKVYESMAAGVPVVSTSIGAEGLTYHAPVDIRIADDPQSFADQCLELIENSAARQTVAHAALRLVTDNFSSESVAKRFEELLAAGPEPY